jgi:hypothetical protein
MSHTTHPEKDEGHIASGGFDSPDPPISAVAGARISTIIGFRQGMELD